jgi:uncharacterized membrane protein YfcA
MTAEIINISLIALIAFCAALAQGATGFGFAIIALPFMLLVLGSLDAIGLTIILNLLVSLVLAPGLWRQAPRGPLLRLSLGSAVGFPIGLAIFLHASLDWVRLAIGLIILLFAAALAWRQYKVPTHGELAPRPWQETLVGVLSGAMATALAMPGPAAMLYLSARGMAKDALRACTLCLFALSYGAALVLQAGAGAVASQAWLAAAFAALPTVLGAIAGNRLSSRLDEGRYRTIILSILLATGAYTTGAAMLSW